MTIPMNFKFQTTSTDYDLFQDEDISVKIKERFGESSYNSLINGMGKVSFTVFIDSPSQIKFKDDDTYDDFIKDKVFSSNGTTYPSKIIIKDAGVTGMLSLQFE